jgi:hypothetical protein
VGLFLVFYSVPLVFMFVFVPVPCCFCSYNFFSTLGLELRASCLLGRHTQPFFVLAIFQANYLPGLALNLDLPDLCLLSS